MFIGFVLGVGSLALPLMTRGDAPPDAGASRSDRLARLANVSGAALLVASFWIEANYSLRVGMLLRAAVILVALVYNIDLWRPPVRAGWNARAIWLAAWMVPLATWSPRYSLSITAPAFTSPSSAASRCSA